MGVTTTPLLSASAKSRKSALNLRATKGLRVRHFGDIFGDIFEVLGVNFRYTKKRAEKALKNPCVARVFLILIHIEITSFLFSRFEYAKTLDLTGFMGNKKALAI